MGSGGANPGQAGNGTNSFIRAAEALGQGDAAQKRSSQVSAGNGVDLLPKEQYIVVRNGAMNGVKLAQVAMRPPEADEVVVKVGFCGLCGSDIPRLQGKDMRENERGKRWGGNHFDEIAIGHEFTGIVVAYGQGVEDGDSILGNGFAIAPLKPCHCCASCNDSKFGQCADYSFIGSREDGGFAQFVTVPRQNLIPLPDGVGMREGALLEPLTCVLHPLINAGFFGVNGAQHKSIDSVLITGPGAIGLLAVQVFKAMGVPRIVISGTRDEPLALARELGATDTFKIERNESRDALAIYIHKRGGLVQLVFDASGDLDSDISCVAEGGDIIMVGKADPALAFEGLKVYGDITRKEMVVQSNLGFTLRGSQMSYGAGGKWPGLEWAEGLKLMAKGAIDAAKIIGSDEFGFDTFNDGVMGVLSGKKPVKLMFRMDNG
jgi:threonine dehydrogenase-like Zn-dependent dehydrogenase